MNRSNIVAGSNVYLSREEHPFWDKNFVNQVKDYSLIKYMYERREVDNRVCMLSMVQQAIRKTEKRCVYAKKDPCWGYDNSQKKVVSACINGMCPRIMECNKSYSLEQAAFWNTSDEERALYGNPEMLRRYYIVDMISDEEMQQYATNPENDGRDFSVKNPIIPDEKKKEKKEVKTRIDSKTGRKMVVVGHRWVISDNASYENEELVPIWGFADEVDERKLTIRKKAKRIEKYVEEYEQEDLSYKKLILNNSELKVKTEYEEIIREHISYSRKLVELNSDNIELQNSIIVCANEAEKAYVSSMLMLCEIEHGFDNTSAIQLTVIDNISEVSQNKMIWISNTLLKEKVVGNCIDKWKWLSEQLQLIELIIPDREYFYFTYSDKNRWCCRNMYGVTHICINVEDIEVFEIKQDGLYQVSLVYNKNFYTILQSDGSILGKTNMEFANVISELKKAGEIVDTPAIIKGISIKIHNGKKSILGMGHMKFIEY